MVYAMTKYGDLIAAYTSTGGGVAYMLFLLFFGPFAIWWIMYWWSQNLNGTRPFFRASRFTRLSVPLFIAVFMILFPPLRPVGNWKNLKTAQMVNSREASTVDRLCYGYIPSYRWIGFYGHKEEEHCVVTLKGRDPYVLSEVRLHIDWPYAIAQIVLVVVLVLPILWNQKVEQRNRTQKVESERRSKQSHDDVRV